MYSSSITSRFKRAAAFAAAPLYWSGSSWASVMTSEVTDRATPRSGSSIRDIIRSAHVGWTIPGCFRYNRSRVKAAFFFTNDLEALTRVSLVWPRTRGGVLTVISAACVPLHSKPRPSHGLRHWQ